MIEFANFDTDFPKTQFRAVVSKTVTDRGPVENKEAGLTKKIDLCLHVNYI